MNHPTTVRTVRTLQGIVVSNKSNKTIVVEIARRVIHGLCGKVINKSTKLHVHDEQNECCIGDKVSIQPSRPISKKKNWQLVAVLEKARV